MSDAKWRKFFRATADNASVVFAATWKLVDELEPVSGSLPRSEDIWDAAVDGCLNGPVEYAQIEWIAFPREVAFYRYANAPVSYRQQDLARLKLALEEVGQLPLEETSDGLLLRAYASPAA